MKVFLRHGIGIGIGLVLFLVMFSVLQWSWWIALVPALLAYGLVWIMLAPRVGLTGDVVPGLGREDHRNAMRQCRRAATELKRHVRKLSLQPTMATAFGDLAEVIDNIGKAYKDDPADVLHTRGLTDHHLPVLMGIVGDYMRLRDQELDEDGKQRLKQIALAIEGYVPRFQEIHKACIKRDFTQLEISTRALDQIMESERPG